MVLGFTSEALIYWQGPSCLDHKNGQIFRAMEWLMIFKGHHWLWWFFNGFDTVGPSPLDGDNCQTLSVSPDKCQPGHLSARTTVRRTTVRSPWTTVRGNCQIYEKTKILVVRLETVRSYSCPLENCKILQTTVSGDNCQRGQLSEGTTVRCLNFCRLFFHSSDSFHWQFGRGQL